MIIPTEPIGSIPRPLALIEAVATRDGADPASEPLYEEANSDTAFEKIRARVLGTALAAEILGGS
jgi:hypothetical protein